MGMYTVQLGDIGRDDLALVGGKAAGLGELVRAGFPVPPGFVITTAAYRDFLGSIDPAPPDPERLRDRIAAGALPDALAATVAEAYRELGSPTVAVRSSGTAEDLADASFAGQHDTFLNISGETALLAAVRDCWASLWAPRAVAYRQRTGWQQDGLALAVVVQAMIDAQWAGAMFTVDPVSGDRDRMVIEAVPGLGEALVSGEATGHHIDVAKGTGRPLNGDTPVPDGLIGELAQLGSGVEVAFGAPQDIEWAFAAGRCWLVQARPLTALPDAPVATSTRRSGTRQAPPYQMAADHLPYPPYPMDVSLILRPALQAILTALRAAGMRTPDLDALLVDTGDTVVRLVPPRIRPTIRAAWRLPLTLPTIIRLLRTRHEQWQERYAATIEPLARRIDTEDLAALPDGELMDRARTLLRAAGALVPSRFGAAAPGLVADGLLLVLLRRIAGAAEGERLHTELTRGVRTITADANRELAGLAATIRRTPELLRVYTEEDPDRVADRLRGSAAGAAFLSEVDGYLHRYGLRELSLPTVSQPALREVPEVVHGLLRGLAAAPAQPHDGPDDGARAERARDSLAALLGPHGRLLGPLARVLLAAARAAQAFREDTHYQLYRVNAVARRPLLELGKRLASRGVLAAGDDIFFLMADEVAALPAEQARQAIARRRAARDAALHHYTIVPAELLGTSRDGTAISGVPAGRGSVVGRVRIIRDQAEFGRLAKGEILVCPYTNPTWTPLFAIAAAVVVDAGGAASHAAIVAREYGIPAVMGTGDATRVLRDGQRVLVNGDRGTVTPL